MAVPRIVDVKTGDQSGTGSHFRLCDRGKDHDKSVFFWGVRRPGDVYNVIDIIVLLTMAKKFCPVANWVVGNLGTPYWFPKITGMSPDFPDFI